MPSFTRASFSKNSKKDDLQNSARSAALRYLSGLDKEASVRDQIIQICTAAAIMLAVIYSLLHYIPLLKQVDGRDALHLTSTEPTDAGRNPDGLHSFSVSLESHFMRRTPLRSGQSVRISYDVPPGAKIDLHIRQCRRIYVLEVFICLLRSKETIRITGKTRGSRILQFPDGGFYHFSETVRTVDGGGTSKVVWLRGESASPHEKARLEEAGLESRS
ncbi:MAG: hypothetical protein WBG08_06480 [Litorimonas sp.]